MKQPLFFLLLLSGLGAAAQTEQGNFLVGGTAQLSTVQNKTFIELSPSAGYFLTDDFAAGVNVALAYSKNGKGSVAIRETSFGFGPFIRYYTGSAGVRPFLEGNVNFASTKYKTSNGSTTSTGLNYFVGPGAAIFLNRNVALEALAGYSHNANKNQSGNGGFAFKLGFQVYLSNAEVKTVTQ